MRLYEIASKYHELERMLDGSDVDMQDIASHMNECDDAMREKVVNIAMLIRNLEVTADAMREAEATMEHRRKIIETRIDGLKNYVLSNMQSVGINKVECEFFNVSVRSNPESVIVDDEKMIPQDYWRFQETPPPVPDKKKILDAIKNGKKIDGVHTERKSSLNIK